MVWCQANGTCMQIAKAWFNLVAGRA